MSPFIHRFLAYTQYVSPLMADFDTTYNEDGSGNIYLEDLGKFTLHGLKSGSHTVCN